MQNPLKLIAFVIIIVAIANLTFGSSALIEQVVNAQNMTETTIPMIIVQKNQA